MTELFRRSGLITIDTIEIVIDPNNPGRSLDVAFDIYRTTKPEPNTADLQVWNMNPTNRLRLEELPAAAISVEAGYLGQTSLLFLGLARTVFSERSGPDIITTLQSGDGEKEYQQARINISIKPGATNLQAFDAIIDALGFGAGNISNVLLEISGAKPLFPQGATLSGSASQILLKLTESLGLEFSIQNNTLQFLGKGEPLSGLAVLLTPQTGLVGSPSVDNNGILTAQALLIPDIFPGRLVTVESEFLSASFRVESCRYTGDTAGQAWYVDIEATKI